MGDHIRLRDFFTHYRGEPHQAAAVDMLALQMPESLMRSDADWVEAFRAAPAPKASPAPPATKSYLLNVPYYTQRDSVVAGQASRMCFSSSCAMMLQALRPGALQGPNGDDHYLGVVQKYGDTTSVAAQLRALEHFGIKASFRQNCDFEVLEAQLSRKIPVPCGFLHHGSVNAPSGGGHWLTVIGITPGAVLVNDPWGECDLINGTYPSTKGKGVAYSRKNWGPRWMADGPGSGWAIIVQP